MLVNNCNLAFNSKLIMCFTIFSAFVLFDGKTANLTIYGYQQEYYFGIKNTILIKKLYIVRDMHTLWSCNILNKY